MKWKNALAALLATALIGSVAATGAAALEPHGTGIPMRNWLTNDPNYTFSEAYKTSVWYENFTRLELTENERNNVLRIAVSQLGYHEGDSAADFDGMNQSGSSNYIEYARLLVPHYNDNHYEWCACFVNWCLNQAHIDYASSEIGCWRWVQELKSMKMWQDSAAYKGTYTPKPADMIFFNWDNVNTGSGHIGYVFYTTETHVYTIEGNADNNVTVRSYALDNPCIIGYGTPPYNEGNEPTIDYSYADGMPRGYYVVNSYSATLTRDSGSNRICRVPAGSLVELTEVEGNYARVTYGDKEGYLPAACLELMILSEGEDILTYDANGGTGAPEAVGIRIGDPATVSETVPTLEGDTFLGWSLKPYNCKVDFKPGDSISLAGDTTLYAVWKIHSLELAKEAMAEGLVAEFDRPAVTANSGALLLGTLSDLSVLRPTGDTDVKLYEDAEAGRVLSFVSTAQSADPYVTLPYAALCKSLRLAPVRADEVNYIVLRVKDVSMYNIAFEIYYDCGAGLEKSVSKLLNVNNEWQYVIFDMTNAAGWSGDIQSLRLDWQKSASEAGNTMLISDICFAANKAVADAVANGLYVYPEQELLEPETDPLTTTPTDPSDTADPTTEQGTLPSSGNTENTDAASDNSNGTTADTQSDNGGCQSVIGASVMAGMAIPAAAVVLKKKRED